MPDTTPWLTLADVAEQLSLSPRTVQRWIRQGNLRAELCLCLYGPRRFGQFDLPQLCFLFGCQTLCHRM
jgi:hypothetical protein